MIRVLTVDLDFLLGNAQNDWEDIDMGSLPNLTPNQFWQVVSWSTGTPLKDIKNSKWRTLFLGDYLYECAKKSDATVKIVKDHHHVYPFLNSMEDIYLVNIDHHHDICYSDYMQEKVNCGNWVYHLARQGKISHYTWFKNSASKEYKVESFDINEVLNNRHYRITIDSQEDAKRLSEKFDYIFIVKSDYYAPKNVQKLANTYRDIIYAGMARRKENEKRN